MPKFNTNNPELWKDYDPFSDDHNPNWDGDKPIRKSSKHPTALFRTIYSKFYDEHKTQTEILEEFPELRGQIYILCKTNPPEYDQVYMYCRYDRKSHMKKVEEYKKWKDQYDYENKPVFLLRSPGKDLLDFYDKKITESNFGRQNSKDGQKYLPSHIYHLRYEKEYDIEYIKFFVKKHYNRIISSADANNVWRKYPWLTDRDHLYFASETKGDIINLIVEKNSGYPDEHMFQANQYVGWSIVHKKGTKWLKDSITFEKIKELLPADDLNEKRDKEAFFKKHSNKKFQIWTETFVVITDPNNKEYIFKQKSEALKFLSKDLKKLGLVVKADRITQIIKDGKILMSRPAGKGSGKGGKEYYDAMPGWTIKIDYRPNGFAVNGKPNNKLTNTIQEAIDRGWIDMPTEMVKKQR